MAVFDVNLYEPIYPTWTADATAVTADSIIYTADGGPLEPAADTTDAGVNAHIYDVDIVEPVGRIWTADSTAVTADSTYWSADGGPLEGASDVTDAEVISAELPVEVGGVVRPLKPFPVVGRGYGILPQLEGEAFGTVAAVGNGVAKLPRLKGAATGSIGVAGRSAGELIIRAAAIGRHGQAGVGEAVLKGLSIASDGAIGIRGSGLGMIVKLNAAAIGRHDDDEAAVMTLLLAA
jgi:hypothetical protein